MKNKMSNEDIALLTFKNLTMVLKRKKLYPLFRCFVGGLSLRSMSVRYSLWMDGERFFKLSNTLQRHGSPFLTVENYMQIIDILIGATYLDDTSLRNDSKVQMLVVQYTNNLLHYCLEGIVDDYMGLEEIGRETFELTCKKIFGDDFVDETEKEIPEDARRFMDAQREFMMSDKGRGIRLSELSSHPSFIDFMNRKLRTRLSQEDLASQWIRTVDTDDAWYDIESSDLPW